MAAHRSDKRRWQPFLVQVSASTQHPCELVLCDRSQHYDSPRFLLSKRAFSVSNRASHNDFVSAIQAEASSSPLGFSDSICSRPTFSRFICGRPPTCKDWLGQHARIACAHMSGLRLGLRPLAKMGFANSEIQTRERHLLPVNRAETLPVRLAPITPPLPILQVPALASDLRC